MNVQQWQSMSERERVEWARFQEWQRAQSRAAQSPVPQQRAPWAATAAAVRPPRHVQLGSRTARRLLMASSSGIVLILATIVIAAIADLGAPSTRTVSGVMTVLSGSGSLYSGSSYGACTLSGGYDDITAGTTVTARDSSGTIAGVGALGSGTGSSYGCAFSFTVDDVPASDFYTVEVGHRGEVTFTDAAVRDGDLRLSLG
ncbi:hypothetical protein [Pseudonocardia alni]|uniref:Uncharacterized protein n=1 Tax=Pseudonocardia alni TaxID=33907 RepID=A0A852W0N2_PSEA5|nr:hypothetical protein [Pseudonocardia antarctica]NYF99974.1 hypothetical protein [Pseudonocardia antarctica]